MSEVKRVTLDKDQLIENAHWGMKCACEDYISAIEDSIPEGTIVYMKHGKRWLGPYEVLGVVDCWWSSPGKVMIRNLKTGKHRDAFPSQLSVQEGSVDE